MQFNVLYRWWNQRNDLQRSYELHPWFQRPFPCNKHTSSSFFRWQSPSNRYWLRSYSHSRTYSWKLKMIKKIQLLTERTVSTSDNENLVLVLQVVGYDVVHIMPITIPIKGFTGLFKSIVPESLGREFLDVLRDEFLSHSGRELRMNEINGGKQNSWMVPFCPVNV